MSATGRNLPGKERHENDYYETPGWTTRAILPFLRKPTHAIDAGAGQSWAILKECRAFWGTGTTIIGLDTDPLAASGVMGVYQDDFLTTHVHENFPPDLIISNPPYSLAQEFAERALVMAPEVAFLLRLPWLASQKRVAFHRAHPADIYVLPKRPSFTGDGGTDATDYAWFVWGADRGGRWKILDPPSEAEVSREKALTAARRAALLGARAP